MRLASLRSMEFVSDSAEETERIAGDRYDVARLERLGQLACEALGFINGTAHKLHG